MNRDLEPDPTTARLATFIADTTYDDLPAEVVEVVKWAVLDTLAVTVAGVPEPTHRAVASLAAAYGGPAQSTVIGRSLRCDPAWAALVNATTGHALDYDDQSWTMGGHPSVVLLPSTLALAESRGTSGRELIRAYALGFECGSLVGSTVNPEHYGHGWHTTGTVGSVAAACASAALLGLDEHQTVQATAGASSAAGLRQNFGTGIKPLHAGNAARAGVLAAELAARGFEGNAEILEGRWGFFNVFTPAPIAEREPRPRIELGTSWHLVEPGIATKVFPACGATHPGIGAVLELRERGLRAEDVESIEVRVVDMTARILENHRPATGLEAKFSMEYCLARALVSGTVSLDHFLDEAVRDEAVNALIARTRMEVDPVLTKEWVWGTPRATEISVTLRDGQRLAARADLPPGSPGNFRPDALEAKVTDCLGRSPVVGSQDEITAAVAALDTLADVRELTALLAGRE